MAREFIKGNEAIGKSAIMAGCRFYVGYPITPQNDVPEFMSRELPKVNGTFLQGESEVASANILNGANATNVRAMTTTSGPGLSLMAEGISFACGCEIPNVYVDVARPGPGMGGIDAAQDDYFYVVKGPGNGGGRPFVMSPDCVQELVDQVYEAFDIADKYRTPVVILSDAVVGQSMEIVDMPEMRSLDSLPDRSSWCLSERSNDSMADRRMLTSIYQPNIKQEQLCLRLAEKHRQWEENEVRYESYRLEDAEIVLFAYGSVGRVCKACADMLRDEGIKVGVFRPITLYPFPMKEIGALPFDTKIKKALCVEMTTEGKMIEDVQRAVGGRIKVEYLGRGGGFLVRPTMVLDAVRKLVKEV